jgi:hypothetical protein
MSVWACKKRRQIWINCSAKSYVIRIRHTQKENHVGERQVSFYLTYSISRLKLGNLFKCCLRIYRGQRPRDGVIDGWYVRYGVWPSRYIIVETACRRCSCSSMRIIYCCPIQVGGEISNYTVVAFCPLFIRSSSPLLSPHSLSPCLSLVDAKF